MPALRRWGGDLAHPPVLVGEDNPQSSRPAHALWPEPPGCAGHRLCVKIFGMDPRQYMLAFVRYNLCTGKWDAEEAERRARGIFMLYGPNPKILLGTKVAKTCGYGDEVAPFKVIEQAYTEQGDTCKVLFLPHPSGRCRVWNDPRSYERARDALEEAVRG